MVHTMHLDIIQSLQVINAAVTMAKSLILNLCPSKGTNSVNELDPRIFIGYKHCTFVFLDCTGWPHTKSLYGEYLVDQTRVESLILTK